MGGQKNNPGGNGNKGVSPINTMNKHRSEGTPMMLAASKEQPLSSSWLYAAIIAGLVLLGSGWLISKSNSGAVSEGDDADVAADGALDVIAAVTEEQEKKADDEEAAGKKPASPPTSPAALTTLAKGEAVTIRDQAAGSNVTISDMTITKVSWVAVRDAKTKWILGARRFEPGQKTGIVVLLRNTVADTKYEGVIYVDDGDKAFNHKKDILVNGVVTSFTAL